MKLEHLIKIKEVYEQIQRGISIPNDIKEAYSYIDSTPSINGRQMITSINRFMTFRFNDELKTATPIEPQVEDTNNIPPFIGDKRSVEYKQYKLKYNLE